jgi:hypothetical protein
MNDLEITNQQNNDVNSIMSDVQSNRQIAEVQGSMVIAKKFPRDEIEAIKKIKNACKRRGLAESATYSYPRGGQKVEGPSIRLAETLARYWGNIDYGMVELERGDGYTLMMAYCSDLETNTRSTKVFKVEHVRERKKGNVKLTDPRDIYEIGANMGARRMRSCIMAVIPGDVQDLAVEECNKTLAGNNSEPIRERVEKMIATFGNFDVTRERIEAYLGYAVTGIDERKLVEMIKIYNSIKDGIGKVEDFFPAPGQKDEGRKKVDINKDKKPPKQSNPPVEDQNAEDDLPFK